MRTAEAEDTRTSQEGHVVHYMALPLVTLKCTEDTTLQKGNSH